MRTAPFHNTIEAIVVGASAGAVDALLQILPSLPPAFPIPVLIVVHLPPTASVSLALVLSAHCRIPVKEAEDKEPIQAGTIYVAPPNYHLLVEPSRKLSLSMDEPVLFSRPSIDVLFESAADSYGTSVAGVILTGANSDGARGLRAIAAARGTVLVQEPASAEASAMPQAALEACPTAHV
jgi:two-component system chemotaxis response regulator CheB